MTPSQWGLHSQELNDLVASPLVGALVVYTWSMDPDLLALARERGVRAVLAKSLTGSELLDALERVLSEDFLVAPEQA